MEEDVSVSFVGFTLERTIIVVFRRGLGGSNRRW